MECHRCQGLMVVDYYIDMEDDQGTHWLRAWRCMACGEVIDPGILQRRLVRESKLPGFSEPVPGRRKRRLHVNRSTLNGKAKVDFRSIAINE